MEPDAIVGLAQEIRRAKLVLQPAVLHAILRPDQTWGYDRSVEIQLPKDVTPEQAQAYGAFVGAWDAFVDQLLGGLGVGGTPDGILALEDQAARVASEARRRAYAEYWDRHRPAPQG